MTALQDDLGDRVSDLVAQISVSGITFCASGDVINLSLDAVLDRIADS